MKSAMYPGSFDPITLGHISIIKRGLNVFDHIRIIVASNNKKNYLFTLDERVDLIYQSIYESFSKEECKSIDVGWHNGLIVDYASINNIGVIIRGLRAVSDFEFEIQMANTNRKLNQFVDTMFFMTEESHLFTSSSIVREIAKLGGKTDGFVTNSVAMALKKKFNLE